jgi:4-hydroxy-tetrahydrodipicolinate synthase
LIPSHVTIGVSDDRFAATGLHAGCEAWHPAIGGLFPKAALPISRAGQAGNACEAGRLSEDLGPLWAMFSEHGSLRVVAAAAELRGLVGRPSLPLPLKALDGPDRLQLADFLERLALTKHRQGCVKIVHKGC